MNVCDDCYMCQCFWQNNDTGNECEGQEEKCHEWIEDKWLKDRAYFALTEKEN